MVRITLSGVKDSLDPVTPGEYPITLTEVNEGVSEKGNPKIDLKFTITEEADEFGGRSLFMSVGVTDQSLWRVKQVLRALGADDSVLEGDDVDLGEAFGELIGMEALGKVRSEMTPDGRKVSRLHQITAV